MIPTSGKIAAVSLSCHFYQGTSVESTKENIDQLNETGKRKDKDRRGDSEPVASERRKVQRRRLIDPTTCERDYTNDEIEFMQAMDDYKRRSGRMFPTCSEILEVLRGLGYVRIEVNQCESPECPDSITDGNVRTSEAIVADLDRLDESLDDSADDDLGDDDLDDDFDPEFDDES